MARCEAEAQKGTGTGICDRPLNERGECDRASKHLYLDEKDFEPYWMAGDRDDA